MENSTTLKGMILGMEQMGAKFVKNDGFHLFFDVPIGTDIDDESKLKKAKQAFTELFSVGLKIRRINTGIDR